MKREAIVFVLVLLVLALMGYQLTQHAVPKPARNAKSRSLESFPELPLETVVSLPAADASRDIFLRPSADQPLPPLVLPAPPLAAFPVLMPPPLPSAGMDGWCEHLFVLAPSLRGGLEELFAEDGLAPDPTGGEGLEGASSAPAATDAFADQGAAYRQAYDWIRLSPVATVYGHILNEDRYDLPSGAELRFVEVDPRSGKERYGERRFSADHYESYGFAETLRNAIEMRIREERAKASAARVDDMRRAVQWFLAQGLQEPIAFRYAEELARQAVTLAADDLASWLSLGEVWERTFAFDQAFAMYASLVGESRPQAAQGLDLELPVGRFAYASAPRVRMAGILERLGLMDEARAQLEQAMALGDGDPAAPLALGRRYLADGRLEEGQALIQRALGLQPRRHSPEALENALAVGEAALSRRQWPQAIAAYEEAARAAAGERAFAARAAAGQAAALYLSGAFSQAHELAQQAILDFGATFELLYLRGLAAAADGGAAGEVIRDLRAAAAAAPFDAAPAWSAQAFWLDRMGETEAALEALDQALTLDPTLPYGRFLKASWEAREGNHQGAQERLLDLARHAPSNPAVLASFGALLYEDESYTQAAVAFRRAEEEFPPAYASLPNRPAWAQLTLRRALNELALGDEEAAIAAAEAALSLDETLLAARNVKAAALYAAGDLEAAEAEFAYVLDLLRDQEEDPQRLYAERWQARILEHDRLRRWTDAFDGRRLSGGWDTQTLARLGVEPHLEDGKLVIRGHHDGSGETRAFRSMPGIAFRQYAGTLAVGNGHQGEAGLYLALLNRSRELWSFRVYRDREGVVAWTTTQGSRQEAGRTSFRIPAGGEARIQFILDRESTPPVLTVLVEDQQVFRDEVSNLRNPTGTLAVGVAAGTAHALDVDVALDDVTLIYAKP